MLYKIIRCIYGIMGIHFLISGIVLLIKAIFEAEEITYMIILGWIDVIIGLMNIFYFKVATWVMSALGVGAIIYGIVLIDAPHSGDISTISMVIGVILLLIGLSGLFVKIKSGKIPNNNSMPLDV